MCSFKTIKCQSFAWVGLRWSSPSSALSIVAPLLSPPTFSTLTVDTQQHELTELPLQMASALILSRCREFTLLRSNRFKLKDFSQVQPELPLLLPLLLLWLVNYYLMTDKIENKFKANYRDRIVVFFCLIESK